LTQLSLCRNEIHFSYNNDELYCVQVRISSGYSFIFSFLLKCLPVHSGPVHTEELELLAVNSGLRGRVVTLLLLDWVLCLLWIEVEWECVLELISVWVLKKFMWYQTCSSEWVPWNCVLAYCYSADGCNCLIGLLLYRKCNDTFSVQKL
jgi:hypothetical protein